MSKTFHYYLPLGHFSTRFSSSLLLLQAGEESSCCPMLSEMERLWERGCRVGAFRAAKRNGRTESLNNPHPRARARLYFLRILRRANQRKFIGWLFVFCRIAN